MRTEPLIDKKNDDGWGCPESIYKVGGCSKPTRLPVCLHPCKVGELHPKSHSDTKI